MSSEVQVACLPLTADPVETVRPCAFYMTQMQTLTAKSDAEAASPRSALQHRCLLNPGRAHGPDGLAIGFEQCSVERQAQCQANRRARLVRLNATGATRAMF